VELPVLAGVSIRGPYVAVGNVGLLKHASNVPGCALAIEEVFHDAGFPDGAFQTLLIPSDRVDTVLSDPRVKAATLTGSNSAGQAVASTAGENLKKTVLELGVVIRTLSSTTLTSKLPR